jgi:hypothetical protein
MKNVTVIKFIVFLVITAAVSSVVLFIPDLAEQGLAGTVACTLASTIMLLGAMIYFLSSLRSFKRGLKVAYYLLSIGLILYSFILLQFFIVLLTGLEDIVVRNALFLVPYGTASFFTYLGMRKFARLLEVRKLITSFLFVLILAVVVAVLATLLPVPAGLLELGVDEMTLDAISGVLTWSVVFGMCAGIAALFVRRSISHTYKPAMMWTTVSLFVMAFSALHEFIVKIYFFDSAYVASDYYLWPFILTSVLFLRAGLEFRATQLYGLQLAEDASYTDIITATATLVSKPAAVDAELDKLRAITSSMNNSKQLSSQDKTTLRQVYLYLEEYLVTREPLSKFTRESLRDRLPREFAASLGKQIDSDVFRGQSRSKAKPA